MEYNRVSMSTIDVNVVRNATILGVV